MFALKLLTLTLWLLNSVGNIESECPHCEAPFGPYCCKTSTRNYCCEYPISTEDEPLARTPLARHIFLDNEDLKKKPLTRKPPTIGPTKPIPLKAFTDNTPGLKATMA